MTPGNDDNLSGWLDAMDEAAPEEKQGPTGDAVRSAMQINPRLGEKSEKQVLQEVEAAQKSEKKSDFFADVPNTGINLTVTYLKPRFYEERARLKQKMAQVRAAMEALPEKALERVIAAMLTHDPEMAAPKTLGLLSDKRQFLEAIGFSARKVIDAEKKRR